MLTIIIVAACDYRLLSDGKTQDGQTLGEHSKCRLRKALALASVSSGDVVFICSAGRLKPEHACLHQLQRQFLEESSLWSPRWQIVTPETDSVWGTEGEIQFAKAWLRRHGPDGRQYRLVMVTEDYHARRTRLLLRLNGLKVRCEGANSVTFPPTAEERRHELRSLIGRLVIPPKLRSWIVARDRRRRQKLYNM